MNRVADRLEELLEDLLISAWGIADISDIHQLSAEFPRAISIMIGYSPPFEVYNEERYHHLIEAIRSQLVNAVLEISNLLEHEGVKHQTIPWGGQDPVTLLAEFPHKLAAVRAGMGWIGKNALLITDGFGPRVSLASIVLDIDCPGGKPITTSQCGDCRVCVEACPYDCIHGVNWYPGIAREDLFDPHTCSAKRAAFISKIGHKHECGFCLLSCPVGKQSQPTRLQKHDFQKSASEKVT
jgi:epoxyqueuosine reductase QueG